VIIILSEPEKALPCRLGGLTSRVTHVVNALTVVRRVDVRQRKSITGRIHDHARLSIINFTTGHPAIFNFSCRKVGGLRFIKLGRFTFMFCISREYKPL
jgi:hypothetical protein